MSLFLKCILLLLFIVLICTKIHCFYRAKVCFNESHLYQCGSPLLPALLEKIVVDADIPIDTQEFMYLTDLKTQQILCAQKLKDALRMLALKNKFSDACIYIEQSAKKSISLRLILQSYWTFNKVRISNLFSSNQQYRTFYSLVPCQPFIYKDHKSALQSVKNALNKEGYFDARIQSTLLLDHTYKIIDVKLSINKQKRYTMFFESLSFDNHSDALYKKTFQKCKKAIHNRYYSFEQLTTFSNYLQMYLEKNGFFNNKIILQQNKNINDASVNISIVIHSSKERKFYFEGNSFCSDSVLQSCLDWCIYNDKNIPLHILAQELKEFYYDQGFLKVQVRVCNIGSNNVLFIISEAKKYSLRSITCTCHDSKEFTTLLEEQSLVFKQQGIQKGLQSLYRQIKKYYLKKGYWNPIVDIKLVNYNHDYAIKVNVQQGQQWMLKNMVFDSFPIDVSILVDQQSNQIINPDFIEQQRQLIIDDLQQKGYVYATIGYTIKDQDDESCYKTIRWTMSGFDKKTHFGKFVVQGPTLPFLKDIKKELLFTQNQLWNQSILSESLHKLLNSTSFESVHIKIHEIDIPQEHKHVIARLAYDDSCQLRVRAGFQQVSKTFLAFAKGTTYKCGGSFLYKNITQLGDWFLLDGDITRFYRNISLSYQRPWLLDSVPLRSVFKGYSNYYIQPLYIGSDKPLYQAFQQGCLMGLRRKWSHIQFGNTLGIEWMQTNHLSTELAHAIDFAPQLIDHKVPYIVAESDIALNYLDNQLNPSEGILSIMSLKVMVPCRVFSLAKGFLRCISDTSLFTRLMDNLILGLRIRVGHIVTQQLSGIMPPERFYLGGQNSIRSYQPDFCPPLGLCTTGQKTQYVPQGGRSLGNGNIELRYTFLKRLGIVFFHDIGSLTHDKGIYSLMDHVAQATGFGLRYLTPIGPARFDIAWKWRKTYAEESWYAWYITLGHAF